MFIVHSLVLHKHIFIYVYGVRWPYPPLPSPLPFPFIVYPLDVEWGEEQSQCPWQYSSWESRSIIWVESTQNPIFTTVSQSLAPEENQCGSDVGWEGWFALAPALRCLGAGAHTAVGYRCLLSGINVASMWNHGTAILHKGPRLL